MSTYEDCHLGSRHRPSYPNGHTYDFNVPDIQGIGSSTNYQIVVQNADIPNQYSNVFEGVNNVVYFRFTTPPAGYDPDTSQHRIMASTGNYNPNEWALALTNGIQAVRPAQWLLQPTVPQFDVQFDNEQATLVFTFTTDFGIQLEVGDDETTQTGNPPVRPSARTAEMLGLHRFYHPFAGSSPIISTLASPTTRGDVVDLAGSKVVYLVCEQLPTNNMHPSPQLNNHILAKIPLGELGTVTHFERNDTDHGSTYVEGVNLSNLHFTLYDEWGNKFILPSNQNILFTLRLYPNLNSDYIT